MRQAMGGVVSERAAPDFWDERCRYDTVALSEVLL